MCWKNRHASRITLLYTKIESNRQEAFSESFKSFIINKILPNFKLYSHDGTNAHADIGAGPDDRATPTL